MNLSQAPAAIDYLMGRRFEFADGSAPDVTVTGGDVQRATVRMHGLDGSRADLPLADVCRAVTEGVLVESQAGVPFVLDRAKGDRRPAWGSLRTGVAGTGKRLLRLVPGTGQVGKVLMPAVGKDGATRCGRCDGNYRNGHGVEPWRCRECSGRFCEHLIRFRDVNGTGVCGRCQRRIAADFGKADAS